MIGPDNTYSGFSYDLIQKISENTRYEFELYETEDDDVKVKTNGMVNALVSGVSNVII